MTLEPRHSEVPGPRTRVILDVAEASLPTLLEGVPAARVYLTDEGDGVYAFHADLTLGESRKQPGEPAIDILVRLVNQFADELDGDDVPQRLRDRWEALVDEYVAHTGPPDDAAASDDTAPESASPSGEEGRGAA